MSKVIESLNLGRLRGYSTCRQIIVSRNLQLVFANAIVSKGYIYLTFTLHHQKSDKGKGSFTLTK